MKWLDRGDGTCRYLRKDNLCVIYNRRPNLCRGKFIYEKYHSHMRVIDFHNMCKKICDRMEEL